MHITRDNILFASRNACRDVGLIDAVVASMISVTKVLITGVPQMDKVVIGGSVWCCEAARQDRERGESEEGLTIEQSSVGHS